MTTRICYTIVAENSPCSSCDHSINNLKYEGKLDIEQYGLIDYLICRKNKWQYHKQVKGQELVQTSSVEKAGG